MSNWTWTWGWEKPNVDRITCWLITAALHFLTLSILFMITQSPMWTVAIGSLATPTMRLKIVRQVKR